MKAFLGKRTKGKKSKGNKNKGRDYGGPFGGGGLTTQNGAKSKPPPPSVIHNFVRDALNTRVHDIFNPSKPTMNINTKKYIETPCEALPTRLSQLQTSIII